MRTTDRPHASGVPVTGPGALEILLIEDDLGDALLVQEFLDEGELDAHMIVARSFREARLLLDAGVSGFRCILLDLSLPDANGLDLLREVLRLAPHVAVLVLTGLNDAQVGVAAVAAGAQDYLVKQEVEAPLLARAVRYAIERKRADESERELVETRLLSQENTRLARGLLPVPQLRDTALHHHTRYRPGRRRALLGGDFYDTIQTFDGAVHLMIGDVSGHGPDEASLGVRLRMAWRTLILTGLTGGELLATLDTVLTLERWTEEIFTTLCMVTIEPDRRYATMYRAGHPRPLLFTDAGVEALPEDALRPGHRPVLRRRVAGGADRAAGLLGPDALHRRPDRGPGGRRIATARHRGPAHPDPPGTRTRPKRPGTDRHAGVRRRGAQRRRTQRRHGDSAARRRTIVTTNGDVAEPLDPPVPEPETKSEPARPMGPPLVDPEVISERKGRVGRVRIGQWFGLGGLLLGLILVASLAQSADAIYRQSRTRDMVTGRIVPAALLQPQLSGSIGQQDTAIRAYAASHDAGSLAAYRQQIATEARTSATMRRLLTGARGADRSLADIAALDAAAAAWRAKYAEPLVAAVGRSAKPSAADFGAQPFAQIRSTNATLQRDQTALFHRFEQRLDARVNAVYWSLGVAVLIAALTAIGLTLLIRRAVLRPLSSLATNVRAVAQGDFGHPLDVRGSAEFVELAAIVDGMRQRIMDEWRFTSDARRQLDEQATELRRSNAELEQFAYVASHDLQEPLRKVASFCQMLERKYGDKLDDRGRQYISFAVDGAKRMQVLINDLLNFSRVGRIERREQIVDVNVCFDRALANLAQLREDTEAEVTSDEMPRVSGDQTQLTQLLQNLIGNALKFHGDEPPRVQSACAATATCGSSPVRTTGSGSRRSTATASS